jgi:hypothetical protein
MRGCGACIARDKHGRNWPRHRGCWEPRADSVAPRPVGPMIVSRTRTECLVCTRLLYAHQGQPKRREPHLSDSVCFPQLQSNSARDLECDTGGEVSRTRRDRRGEWNCALRVLPSYTYAHHHTIPRTQAWSMSCEISPPFGLPTDVLEVTAGVALRPPPTCTLPGSYACPCCLLLCAPSVPPSLRHVHAVPESCMHMNRCILGMRLPFISQRDGCSLPPTRQACLHKIGWGRALFSPQLFPFF